jgi:hypothetical protein
MTYLRGCAGYVLVADGTRRSTLEVARSLRHRVEAEHGQLILVQTRLGELGVLFRAIAECAVAVATGFVQADKMGATEPNPAKEEDRQ